MKNYAIIIYLLFSTVIIAATETKQIPRTIAALYAKSDYIKDISNTKIHKFAEMPLNFLGFKLEYFDINEGLPELHTRQDIAGVISWYNFSYFINSPLNYIDWAAQIISYKKPFIIIGNPGFTRNTEEIKTPLIFTNKLWNCLGIEDTGNWVELTLGYQLKKQNPLICDFERNYPPVLPPFKVFNKISEDITTVVAASNSTDSSKDCQLITASEKGGYVQEDYFINFLGNYLSYPESLQWYIDPFKYFAMIFKSNEIPKPDITTLAGRRIYFSHIDGDGWLNYTKIASYRGTPEYCPQIIMDKIFKKYPDMPVSVAPIIAEIYPKYYGNKESERLAKEILSLPQIEAASHTYSHPYSWKYFENKQNIKEEYDKKSFWDIFKPTQHNSGGESKHDDFSAYTKPRTYAFAPFGFNNEFQGSLEALKPLLPKGKEAKLIQWSGDCRPYINAMKELHKYHFFNINGGDSRFDNKYPSYANISPIGRQVGKYHQIYAQTSNENTYTDLWTKNFFAFKYYRQTAKNTNSPIRISPIGIYYHMYSGEHTASVDAVISNIEYALTQNIIPITTLEFCKIAEGFYSTEFVKASESSWIVKNRGGLETIRFSKALFTTVDYSNSIGIIGHKHFEGSLYVYLDRSISEPRIHLKSTDIYWRDAPSEKMYLFDSSWQIWDLSRNSNELSFSCKGFGNCGMNWIVPENGYYKIQIPGYADYEFKAEDNILSFNLKFSLHNKPLLMTISKIK